MQGDLFDHTGVAKPGSPQRFSCILADPPWEERGGGKICRGAQRHYPLMKTAEIARLPVDRIAMPDAHLWLWVTVNFLEDGLRVMSAWGFRYVSQRVWVKGRAGLGQYFRMQHEILLFGSRGQARVPEPAGRRSSVIQAERTKHSAKPEAVYRDIAACSPGPRIELFSRKAQPGWTVLGNQAKGQAAPDLESDIDADLWALVDGAQLPKQKRRLIA